MNSTQVFEKRKIAVAIGIDLAKDHCDVVAYNADNKVCFSKANMSFPKLMEWLANAHPAVVLMESCKGCHVRARDIADLGHDARLVKGADVKALRNVCQKNDIRDADYIARLLYVPGTKFVFVKNQRQQSLQFLQNEYKSFQELRIQVGNQIHAGLEEFGCPARKSTAFIQSRMVAHLEKNAELIPEAVMASFLRRREMWLNLFEQEEGAKKRMEEIAKTDDDAKRIMTIPGGGCSDGSRNVGAHRRRHRAFQKQRAVCCFHWACSEAEQHRWQHHVEWHHKMRPQEAARESGAMRTGDSHARRQAEREFWRLGSKTAR